jgi:arginine decarboxylase
VNVADSDRDCHHIYALHQWSTGYFQINAAGHLCACPDPEGDVAIDLITLITRLQQEGLSLPILVRFDDILRHRVKKLQDAFATAIARHHYNGLYHPVYPIKVNQQYSIVRTILDVGGIGLEAGSKPELMAVLSLLPRHEPLICNGYKDRDYLRLALLGCRLGLNVFIVIEKISEWPLILEEARRLNVQPQLGVRVRLAAAAAGKWQNSGGEKSKFGLSAQQVLTLIATLREQGCLDWLQLLHAHLGSQIPNIQDIHEGASELARFYAELRALEVPITTIDFGGGLGVDYEGTQTRAYCSINYKLTDYADALVAAVATVCKAQQLEHPHLITESGRALTAHHAVLIVDVIDRESALSTTPSLASDDELMMQVEDVELQALAHNLRLVDTDPPVEIYQRTQTLRAHIQARFIKGELTLKQRADSDILYGAICQALQLRLSHSNRRQRELLDQIQADLADKLFCNFSVFQSLPDVWAIDQIFPIVPLRRLHERPQLRAIIQDLTCDSDGCISQYVDQDGIEASLPVHDFDPHRESYPLGLFMVGAYQEILGDMHNLFGDTDTVNIELDATMPEGYRLIAPTHGDAIQDVLNTVHFQPRALLAGYWRHLMAADLEPSQCEQYYLEFKAALYGYTYLSCAPGLTHSVAHPYASS